MAAIWQTLTLHFLVAVGATLLAVFAVRRVHLKETTKAARRRRWRFPRWRRPLANDPMIWKEIMRSKMWGNLYSLRWPLFMLTVNWALGVLLTPVFLLAAIAVLGTFLLMAWYVTNLGLCFSLQSQTTLRSMGATLGTLLFTGGGYMFCCCMVMASSGGSQDGFMIFLAPCIPFLSVFPILAYFEFVRDYGGMTEEGMMIAYGLGIAGYCIAGFCLSQYMVSNFDRLAGRTEGAPERPGYSCKRSGATVDSGRN